MMQPPDPQGPPHPDRQDERRRLAELIGRLLARHWLRTSTRRPTGDDPRLRPRAEGSDPIPEPPIGR